MTIGTDRQIRADRGFRQHERDRADCGKERRTGAPSFLALAFQEHRHDLLHRFLRLCAQRGIVVVGDRVADDRERVTGQAVQFAH